MELRLCGAVQLVQSRETSTTIALPAKSLALLAFLTLELGAHSRSELGSLLWGESDENKSSASLRQALKHLRDVLGDRLATEGGTVSLAQPVDSDVARFRALAREGAIDALTIDIPHVFAGLSLRDAPLFDEWMDRTRGNLLREHRLAIAAAGRAAQKRRDWPTALDMAKRWLSADPLSDEAAHLLIEVLYLMGERDTALASFREYVALRSSEAASPPGLAVRELAKRIEHANTFPTTTTRPTPSRARAIASAPMPTFTGQLIGRDTEWSTLQEVWEQTTSGQSSVVIIDGEAGMGKSRLIDDFVQYANVHSAVVLRGRAFASGVDLPYGPLLDVVRGALSAPGAVGTDMRWLSELARVVPEVRREFPAVPEPANATGSPSLLPEATAQLLLAIAEESPLVIVVDDVQWCDSDSCHVLQFLAQRLVDVPVLWCFGWTPGLAPRDAAASRLVRALRATPSHTRIAMPSLSEDAVWRLVRTLGRIVHPDGARRLAKRVFEVTGGNPLYIIELLKTLFTRGWIRVKSDTQEWIPGDEGAGDLLAHELFPDVQAAIAERVAALPDEQHAVLLTVAALGGPCHTSVLSYVHGISRLRAAHLCDALVERRLVTESDGHYLCAHVVVGQAVLNSMGTSRRREVHRMIALALTDAAASINRAADPGVIARHAAAGGETAMAFHHALDAAAQCGARQAWDDALSWLDLASECAVTPDEIRAADAQTAQVLSQAGWNKPPSRSLTPRAMMAIDRADVDLV
jgi:DNA-binding SARP family transcriptional activator